MIELDPQWIALARGAKEGVGIPTPSPAKRLREDEVELHRVRGIRCSAGQWVLWTALGPLYLRHQLQKRWVAMEWPISPEDPVEAHLRDKQRAWMSGADLYRAKARTRAELIQIIRAALVGGATVRE